MNKLCIALAFSLLACDTDSGKEGKQGKSSQLPQVEVKLPPPPSFKKDHPPERYPDGAYSVYGLRRNEATLKNAQVRIKGYLIELYECPPCARGATCPKCNKPHFFVGDRANTPKDKALMVTDYPEKDPKTRRKLTFEKGAKYYVNGTFARHSHTGFAHADGLLIYVGATPVPTN
jgi:hypothetical protein